MLKLMQYGNAVVGAETEIQALHLTATQMQWSMNESFTQLGITSKLNRRLTARNRRFWAVNRRLSFEVTPYQP